MKIRFDRSLLREAGLLSLSNLLNSASNGLIIVLLNKYLAKPESGAFLYLLSVASPLFIFLSFDMRRKITLNQLDGLSLHTLFSIRNVLATGGLALFGVIGLTLSTPTPVFLLALALIGIGKVFDSVSEINFAIFQHHGAEWAVFVSRLLKVLTCLAAFVLLPSHGYVAIFSLFALCNLIPLFCFEVWLVRRFCPNLAPFVISLRWTDLRGFVGANLSLAVASLIMALSPNVPTYFVKEYMDLSSVTYFSSLNFIVSTIYITGSGLGYAMMKKFGGTSAANSGTNLAMLSRAALVSLGTYLMFGILFFAADGLTLLFNADYAPYYPLFNLLLVGGYLYTVSAYLNNYLLHTNARNVVFRLRAVRIAVIVGTCALLPALSPRLETFGYCLLITNLMDCFAHGMLIFQRQKMSLETT